MKPDSTNSKSIEEVKYFFPTNKCITNLRILVRMRCRYVWLGSPPCRFATLTSKTNLDDLASKMLASKSEIGSLFLDRQTKDIRKTHESQKQSSKLAE